MSLDSVQEFCLLTKAYQAEYGRSAGAPISVVTKSGTSQFHGSGYLFHRNEGLNANNWKNNRAGLPKNKFQFNYVGYTIGGPAYIPGHFNRNRDKLFFFFSQEYLAVEAAVREGSHGYHGSGAAGRLFPERTIATRSKRTGNIALAENRRLLLRLNQMIARLRGSRPIRDLTRWKPFKIAEND